MIPTKKHLEIYKKWVKYWMDEFKIGGWDVYFEIDKSDKENIAGCKWNLKGKTCTFDISCGWGKVNPLSEKNIKESALHEVLHLAMANLVTLANRRYINQDQLEEAQEEAVFILSNYILKK